MDLISLRRLFVVVCGLLVILVAQADQFLAGSTYQVCFAPEQTCGKMLVDIINGAKNQVLVQSYSFTSAPIARALVRAKQRGVNVRVILDKKQFKAHRNAIEKFLIANQVPVWMDNKVNFAHDKVMIIDDSIIATGSFNYSFAAEFENSENIIIIKDTNLAKRYKQHWQDRQQESIYIPESPTL